ncbi:MAG: aspartate dehydrogenase [Kiritimatiellia bacterium]|jgi:aspartate dehydrogenase
MPRRIGIVGFGHLGRYLTEAVNASIDLELAFVWNRSPGEIPHSLPTLDNLEDVASACPDLIVEVAHPDITKQFGAHFLSVCDYLPGSPTAFADREVERTLLAAANNPQGHGLYVPKGALPGLADVLQMAAGKRLDEVYISMRKPPHSMRYYGPVKSPLDSLTEETVIYSGPLRQLAAWAPNNVNTMCVLAMASGVGFDEVHAEFIAVPGLEYHIIEVILLGPSRDDGKRFKLQLTRTNPAAYGAVTGTATYHSFFNSLVLSEGAGSGLHFR